MKKFFTYKRLKRRFYLKQVWMALIFSAAILGLLYGFSRIFEETSGHIRCLLDEHQKYVYLLFWFSELLFSLLPPELFMPVLSRDTLANYALGIASLAMLSYAASWVVYLLGRRIGNTDFFKRIAKQYFRREFRQIKRFGSPLIVIAALTPLSFTAICMIVGATGFSSRYFVWYASSRYLRFLIYGVVFWHAVPEPPLC